MKESLFTVPDSYDEEVLEEVAANIDDNEIGYVAGDIEEDVVLSEDETVAIMANYKQVRQYLHKKALNRGYFRSQAPKTGKGGVRKPHMKAITNGPAPKAKRKPLTKHRAIGSTKA